MRKFVVSLFIVLCGSVWAQQKQSTASRLMPPDYGAKKPTVIGTSRIRIKYAFQAKDLKDEETWIDCGQLLADKGLTQYSSLFVAENDAALRKWLKENPNKSYYPNALNLRGRHKETWSEYQYSQIFVRDGVLTEWAVMPMAEFQQYRYTEPWPPMQWKLSPGEEAVICGYKCQRATCHWRGRDYVAWFTSEIPLKSGPWKFGGLPGLIMKVFDTRHVYTWEAVGVENGRFPILQLEERFFRDSTRKKVLKMQREWNMKYNELSGRMDFNMRPKTQRYPYDPLELTEQ